MSCRCLYGLLLVCIALLVMSIALLELLAAPLLTFKYFVPALTRRGFADDPAIALYYVGCILVQLLNLSAAISLIVAVFVMAYNDRWWLSYDVLTLISCAISLSLLGQGVMTGESIYRRHIQTDMYRQYVLSVGDYQCDARSGGPWLLCGPTNVYVWHQRLQCCGWWEARDLIKQDGHTNNNTWESQAKLPAFCCSKRLMGRVCRMDSVARFQVPCASYFPHTSEFNSPAFSHPASLVYTLIKMVAAFGYAATARHSFYPQGEGIYSYNLEP